MSRRALIVGIDDYPVGKLTGCVADARAMAQLLERNDDGSVNYDCQLFTAPGTASAITRPFLRDKWRRLFENFRGDVLFYFSGHGTPTHAGGFVVTQDHQKDDPGLPMNELLELANGSSARSVLLILDCCFSGSIGNPANVQSGQAAQTILREGVTILAASRPNEVSVEFGGHGVFTRLVLDALGGGAKDVRGRVSAASIYGYVEQALGAWQQTPMYKSHASSLETIRQCTPQVPDALLRELPQIFKTAEAPFQLDPSYEYTHESALHAHVEVFNKFKLLRNAGLLTTVGKEDLYYCAIESEFVALTTQGRFMWQLAKSNRF